jgi:hypothetical protein
MERHRDVARVRHALTIPWGRTVAVVVATVVVTATACTSSPSDTERSVGPSPPSPTATSASPSEPAEPSETPTPEPAPGQIVVPVPEPSGLVTAFGSVWVESGGNDLWKVSRFGKVQARIQDVIRPSDGQSFPTLAAGFGSIWTIRNSQVLRIDPGSDDVVARVTLPGKGFSLSIATDGVWVLCCSGYIRLVRIAADTNAIDRSEREGTSSAGFSTGPGVVWWINSSEAASVSKVESASWHETYIPTPFYVQQVVVTPTWAWLIGDDQIGRIAVGGSKVMRTKLEIPRQVLSATYADGTVWLYSGNLTGFDAETGAIVAHVQANGFEPYDSIAGVGVLAARIWTADPFRDRLVGVRRP